MFSSPVSIRLSTGTSRLALVRPAAEVSMKPMLTWFSRVTFGVSTFWIGDGQ